MEVNAQSDSKKLIKKDTIKSFLLHGPYFLKGTIIGLLAFVLFKLLFESPLYFFIEPSVIPFFKFLEKVLGYSFTSCPGWICFFPTLSEDGWIFLAFLCVVIGGLIGALLGNIKARHYASAILIFLLLGGGIGGSGVYLYLANIAPLPRQCDFFFEGGKHSSSYCYHFYLQQHKEEATETFCQKIKLQDLRGRCLNMVAQKIRNPSYCANLPLPLKESCYSDLAAVLHDKSLCQQLPADSRNRCLASLAGRYYDGTFLCDDIPAGEIKDACIINVVQSQQDVSLCEQLSDPSRRATCVYGIEYEDENLTFVLPAPYEYNDNESEKKCLSEINIFIGRFTGKIFLCPMGENYSDGLYLKNRAITWMRQLGEKKLGSYTYTVTESADEQWRKYEATIGEHIIRAVLWKYSPDLLSYGSVGWGLFENGLSSIKLKK